MSLHDDTVYVRHMLDAAEAVLGYAKGMTEDEFRADRKTQDAVIRQIEGIGEASRHVSAGYRLRHPTVPWIHAGDMRNRLIHGYFEIDLAIVWNTVQHDIPLLRELLTAVVRSDANPSTSS